MKGMVTGLVSALLKTLVLDVLALGCVVVWLRWRRGLDGRQSQEVLLAWFTRAADTVRFRSRGAATAAGKAGQSLKAPFEVAPRVLAHGVAMARARASGVRFLPGRG